MKKSAIIIVVITLIYVMSAGAGTSHAELTVPCCKPSGCQLVSFSVPIDPHCWYVAEYEPDCTYILQFYTCSGVYCDDNCSDDNIIYYCRLHCNESPRKVTAPCDDSYDSFVHMQYYRAVIQNPGKCDSSKCFCDCQSWEMPESGSEPAWCPQIN